MNMQMTLQQIHELVADYNSRRLSMADYRLLRRQLLSDLDAHINGVRPAETPDRDLITVRKHH